jgi:hypothetical protein
MLRPFLALLIALAALPMPAAACDDAMVTGTPMAMRGHKMAGGDHHAPMPASHDCLGCIAVAGWEPAPIAPLCLMAAPLRRIGIAALPLLPGEAPTPPPPRIA